MATETTTDPAGTDEGQNPTGDKPLFAGKYATVEDMEAGYKEQSTKMAAMGEELNTLKADKPAEKPEGEVGSLRIEAAKELSATGILEQAGLVEEEVGIQFREHGKLTDEQYEAIQKVTPVDRATIDDHLNGQIRLGTEARQSIMTAAYKSAGSEEKYNALAKFGVTNLTDAELAKYNEMCDSPTATPESAAMAVDWLAGKYAAATGTSGSGELLAGDTPASLGGAVTTPEEFSELTIKAAAGDEAAMRRIAATSMETIAGMTQ